MDLRLVSSAQHAGLSLIPVSVEPLVKNPNSWMGGNATGGLPSRSGAPTATGVFSPSRTCPQPINRSHVRLRAEQARRPVARPLPKYCWRQWPRVATARGVSLAQARRNTQPRRPASVVRSRASVAAAGRVHRDGRLCDHPRVAGGWGDALPPAPPPSPPPPSPTPSPRALGATPRTACGHGRGSPPAPIRRSLYELFASLSPAAAHADGPPSRQTAILAASCQGRTGRSCEVAPTPHSPPALRISHPAARFRRAAGGACGMEVRTAVAGEGGTRVKRDTRLNLRPWKEWRCVGRKGGSLAAATIKRRFLPPAFIDREDASPDPFPPSGTPPPSIPPDYASSGAEAPIKMARVALATAMLLALT
eukprot:361433-Chlamydomonas_euryale.AAC.2